MPFTKAELNAGALAMFQSAAAKNANIGKTQPFVLENKHTIPFLRDAFLANSLANDVFGLYDFATVDPMTKDFRWGKIGNLRDNLRPFVPCVWSPTGAFTMDSTKVKLDDWQIEMTQCVGETYHKTFGACIAALEWFIYQTGGVYDLKELDVKEYAGILLAAVTNGAAADLFSVVGYGRNEHISDYGNNALIAPSVVAKNDLTFQRRMTPTQFDAFIKSQATTKGHYTLIDEGVKSGAVRGVEILDSAFADEARTKFAAGKALDLVKELIDTRNMESQLSDLVDTGATAEGVPMIFASKELFAAIKIDILAAGEGTAEGWLAAINGIALTTGRAIGGMSYPVYDNVVILPDAQAKRFTAKTGIINHRLTMTTSGNFGIIMDANTQQVASQSGGILLQLDNSIKGKGEINIGSYGAIKPVVISSEDIVCASRYVKSTVNV